MKYINALIIAVNNNDVKMVKYLLKRGADKNTPETDVCYDDFYYGNTPYEKAENNGNKKIMKLLKYTQERFPIYIYCLTLRIIHNLN